MTRPGSGARRRPAAGSGEPPPAPRRRLAATIAGGTAGIVACAALVGLGLLLYRRLVDSSPLVVGLLVLVFGAGGAYAGWIAGMIVFSAVRGERDGA